MNADAPWAGDADAIAAELCRLSPAYAPTPLLALPRLARALGVAQVLAKDEGRRALGSFKSLGGTYAGLRALARAAGADIRSVAGGRCAGLPDLVCASDGNHGLAVAYAARLASARARVFLHGAVSRARVERIAAQGAEIIVVDGTYDDAVAAAAAAARGAAGVLVADTGEDPRDATVRDVMAGYGVIAAELRRQAAAQELGRPTHLFVQAGVGGLAAAMTEGLEGWLAAPASIVVVEPEAAPCVAAALAAGRPVPVEGDLETSAAMLSCGLASAPALGVLLRHGARSVTVDDDALRHATRLLAESGGPATTPSGAAGLAGAVTARNDPALAAALHLDAESRVLLLITETTADDSGG